MNDYGKPEGLADRLRRWRHRLGTDRALPWVGLGLIADIELAAAMLDGAPMPDDRVRDVLVEMGALDKNDTTTDVADMLRILLL